MKEIIKDISSRIPYRVKVKYEDLQFIVLGIVNVRGEYFLKLKGQDKDVSIRDCRLYLRPMSSITEKERKELQYALLSMATSPYDQTKEAMILTIDFYLSHHFDYRGLIEKGLALEAPSDMYKFE